MKKQPVKLLVRLLLLLAVLWLMLATVSCDGGNVYVGVGVSGPYVGYPYGPYGYPYGGSVWVGRPF